MNLNRPIGTLVKTNKKKTWKELEGLSIIREPLEQTYSEMKKNSRKKIDRK